MKLRNWEIMKLWVRTKGKNILLSQINSFACHPDRSEAWPHRLASGQVERSGGAPLDKE